VPAVVKVKEKVEPLLRMPESKSPLGLPGVPEVALWLFATHVHVTVSPTAMLMVRGVNVFPLPTATLIVAARAAAGRRKARARRTR